MLLEELAEVVVVGAHHLVVLDAVVLGLPLVRDRDDEHLALDALGAERVDGEADEAAA